MWRRRRKAQSDEHHRQWSVSRTRVGSLPVKNYAFMHRVKCVAISRPSREKDRRQKRNRRKQFEARQDADSRHGSINKKIHAASDFIYRYCCVFSFKKLWFIHVFLSLSYFFFEVRKCRRGLLWNEHNERRKFYKENVRWWIALCCRCEGKKNQKFVR